MNDEQKQPAEPQQQKKAGRPIGGISRYATIGGQKQSGTQDVQTSRILDVQVSEISDVETSKGSNTKKSKHPDWKQKTVYIPPALEKWLRVHAAEEGREISEIVTQALEDYRQRVS